MSRTPRSATSTAPAASTGFEVPLLLLFCLFSILMIVFPLRNTIELWDESRNANNAVEIAMHGHWIAPTFAGAVDHWNTKPPLLIWIIAALEKLGLPPIVALRLPSELSALATVAVVFYFCRDILKRPFAACIAALLLMSSTLFFGLHVAMSGDYDALLCLLTTLYTLGFFLFVEQVETLSSAGITVAAGALVLAVLCKGIAGVLLLPGLFLYAIVRGRLTAILRDRRFWMALFAVVAGCALYYKGRDLIDPGYLQAVWNNELAGRYNKPNEGHHARTLFYAHYLVTHFEPGTLLLVLGFFSLRRRPTGPDGSAGRSRAAAILCGIVSLIFLLVLTKSQTKIFYYCAPAVPLMSIFAALGLDDALAMLRPSAPESPAPGLRRLHAAAFSALVLALCVTTWFGLKDARGVSAGEQAQYGTVLGEMQKHAVPGPVVLLDSGFSTNANFQNYDPVADYYAKEATRHGTQVSVVHAPTAFPPGTWVVSCDPTLVQSAPLVQMVQRTSVADGCVYGKVNPGP